MFDKDTATQELFRIMLKAIAHPGKIFQLPGVQQTSGNTENDSLAALLYTLLDHETSFSVIGTEAHEELIDKISRCTKSRYIDVEQAEYIVVCGGSSGGMLEHIGRGKLDFPDWGVTVFYLVESLGETGKIRIGLTGPGVKDRIGFSVSGADPGDIILINTINSEFPLGIDIVFVDRSMKIAAIPRSYGAAIEKNPATGKIARRKRRRVRSDQLSGF
jgi:alpha-D-ribose 1-methylphosphonate 5-triphosphate synthase subunit PhnH